MIPQDSTKTSSREMHFPLFLSQMEWTIYCTTTVPNLPNTFSTSDCLQGLHSKRLDGGRMVPYGSKKGHKKKYVKGRPNPRLLGDVSWYLVGLLPVEDKTTILVSELLMCAKRQKTRCSFAAKWEILASDPQKVVILVRGSHSCRKIQKAKTDLLPGVISTGQADLSFQRKKVSVKKFQGNSSHEVAGHKLKEVSAMADSYEKKRVANILRNKALLDKLNIPQELNKIRSTAIKKRRPPTKQPRIGKRRRSSRLLLLEQQQKKILQIVKHLEIEREKFADIKQDLKIAIGDINSWIKSTREHIERLETYLEED